MKLTYDHPRFDSLSRENIQKAVEMADVFFEDNGVEKECRTYSRLLVEDVLLAYWEKNENARFEIILQRSWREVRVFLIAKGERLDILEEKKSIFTEPQVKALATPPEYRYKYGRNAVVLSVPVKTPDRHAIRYVLGFMTREKRAFRMGVVMRFLNMVILVMEPWMAAKIIETIADGNLRGVFSYALGFLVIEAGSSLFTWLGTRFLQRTYNVMRDGMRMDVTTNVVRIKTENIDAAGTGIFTERLVRETANVVDSIDDIVEVITEAFRLISLLAAFAAIASGMLIYELALFVVYLLIVRYQSKKMTEDARRVYASTEAYSGFIGEMVRATRDIKLLHCEDSFIVRVRKVISNCTQRETEAGRRSNSRIMVRSQFVAWTDFVYLVILAIMISRGLPPATALVLYNYNGRVFASTRAVAGASDALYRTMLSAERIYQLKESDDFSRESFGDRNLENVRGEIELRNVRFAYRHNGSGSFPVLKGLSLHIPAGQSAALIGRSGCGKSTVLSLIAHMYDPAGGSVLLDGVDGRELTQDAIRNSIGMVTQSPYLFSMSVRDNFRLVKSDATDEEIVSVCKTACIHDDIMKLPEGYDTMIGEGGSMLSGGQRQRIALARALLKDYAVIMLDEATSALDNQTQAGIRDAIENMHSGRTVIMVAHRLSTVVNCEQLIFIEDGQVLATGTHSELLETCEPYRRLYAEETFAGTERNL